MESRNTILYPTFIGKNAENSITCLVYIEKFDKISVCPITYMTDYLSVPEVKSIEYFGKSMHNEQINRDLLVKSEIDLIGLYRNKDRIIAKVHYGSDKLSDRNSDLNMDNTPMELLDCIRNLRSFYLNHCNDGAIDPDYFWIEFGRASFPDIIFKDISNKSDIFYFSGIGACCGGDRKKVKHSTHRIESAADIKIVFDNYKKDKKKKSVFIPLKLPFSKTKLALRPAGNFSINADIQHVELYK